MTMPLNIKIKKKMVTFSRHANRTSGRFILPSVRNKNVGIQNVRAHTAQSHHRRVRLVGTSSTVLGAGLTTSPPPSLDCVIGDPPGLLPFLSQSEPQAPSSGSMKPR